MSAYLVRSITGLVMIISNFMLFERCSGLKLNQTKSEMLWLGSMRHRKDTMFDLQMSGETVYALGVHFTYDLVASGKEKCF